MIISAIVLAVAVTFQGDMQDRPCGSVVSVLPLPPGPPYSENDPRVRCWFLAYALAWRIDDRGAMLARGGLPADVAEELRFANLRDARRLALLLRWLEARRLAVEAGNAVSPVEVNFHFHRSCELTTTR